MTFNLEGSRPEYLRHACDSIVGYAKLSEGKKILVLGDAILDEWVTGEVKRRSPEAPVLIMRELNRLFAPGGAANVAIHLASLGIAVTYIAPLGDDEASREIDRMLRRIESINFLPAHIEGWTTSHKRRFLSENHQLLRVDSETPGQDGHMDVSTYFKLVEEVLDDGDLELVVLSDYSKGALPKTLIDLVIETCQQKGLPTIVDPKKSLASYSGATVIKANGNELQLGVDLDRPRAKSAMQSVLDHSNFQELFVTVGADGGFVMTHAAEFKTFPAFGTKVLDVTGAGDSFLVGLILGMLGKATLDEKILFGSVLAFLSCESLGTRPLGELLQEMMMEYRFLTSDNYERLRGLVNIFRDSDKSIVFTNGVFDLIHPGHLSTLSFAKSLGDILIVGVNSDESVKRIKAKNRPTQPLLDRMAVLQEVRCVDLVVEFDEDTPLSLIRAIRPDFLVKGGDYDPEAMVGADEVLSWGGKVFAAPAIPGRSSSSILKKLGIE